MSATAEEAVAALVDAAAGTEALLRLPAVADRWEEASALPRMTVGDVAGHAFLALRHGVRMLGGERAAGDVPATPLTRWYARMRLENEDDLDRDVHVQIRADGRHVGARGWENVTDRFARARTDLARVLEERPWEGLIVLRDQPVVATPFVDYVSTRVIELVVHGDDLACSAGAPPPFAATTLTVAIDALLALARARAGDVEVLRALARASRAAPDIMRAL